MIHSLFDRMTEMVYDQPLDGFHVGEKSEACFEVDILGKGLPALRETSEKLGLAFDGQFSASRLLRLGGRRAAHSDLATPAVVLEWDLDYYYRLFRDKIGRNPTSVECFDLAQSNSEHSRHWFFGGKGPQDTRAWDGRGVLGGEKRLWFMSHVLSQPFAGKLVIDGVAQELSLMKMVKATQTATSPTNRWGRHVRLLWTRCEPGFFLSSPI